MDGTIQSEEVDAVRGTAKNPMSHDEVLAKVRDLVAPIQGEANCADLIDKIINIENLKDIRELRPALQKT
jgi:2-methylcitrate dehydratase PrpD